MNPAELKEAYLSFFEKHGHKRVDSASLIPENDPSVLFTTAGMHPLVPFLLGQPHPLGKRIVNVQKCIRTGDIDEVGDDTHFTCFEMLGNWSLGDYFKEDAIKFSFEFLTKELKFPIERLAVTCFKGDNDAADVWKSLGIVEQRIAFLSKKDNWWGPAGQTGPCGPDTEMFYWIEDTPAPKIFDPEDERWVEIWNDVFMQYDKTKHGSFEPLKQTNVDTGMGLERVAMILEGKKNVFEISTLKPVMDTIAQLIGTKDPNKEQIHSMRIITDHIRASVFILGDERDVAPSNLDQGYILRRFIRRAVRHLRLLGLDIYNTTTTVELAKIVVKNFHESYPTLKKKEDYIYKHFKAEENRFKQTLEKGLKQFERLAKDVKKISAKDAFFLFQSFGFPIEMIEELAQEKNIKVDTDGFLQEFKKHQELSRQGAEQKFKGGLADDSGATTALHTATHLLNEALREVLEGDVRQKGSNITSKRLRFDFNFPRKLTDEEKKKIEDLVNKQIQAGHAITKEKMKLDDALKSGAQAEFGARYPPEVWVYTIGDYSKEICTGPHVENTKDMGVFKIKKEQSSAAGIRRIKAVLIKE